MTLTLRKSLFWDVDVQTIDLEKHKYSVVERIVQRGRLEEFKAMIQYYGKEAVKETLLNIRHLDKVTLSFCSCYFNVPESEFRCYKLAQLNPEHWDY